MIVTCQSNTAWYTVCFQSDSVWPFPFAMLQLNWCLSPSRPAGREGRPLSEVPLRQDRGTSKPKPADQQLKRKVCGSATPSTPSCKKVRTGDCKPPIVKVCTTKSTASFHLPRVTAVKRLSIGSDCTGLSTECMALARLGIRNFRHVFGCDICPYSKLFVKNNFPPEYWYDDIKSADHQHAPYVDVYVAGFPCQSFSLAGRNRGLADARGQVLGFVLGYIAKRLPAIFVLENVRNLLSVTHETVVAYIVSSLSKVMLPGTNRAAYDVQWHRLNSKNFGVPQSRERVYIVGRRRDLIKGDMNVFQFSTTRLPSIRQFLGISESEAGRVVDIVTTAKSKVVQKNLRMAVQRMTMDGLTPHKTDMVVDVGNGRGLNMMKGLCPTITKSRGQSGGFFLTSAGRHLTSFELCKLQGVIPTLFTWDGIPEGAIGGLAGNAMTANVLAAVLREALLSMNLDVSPA